MNETNENTRTEGNGATPPEAGRYRPSLIYYHASPRGTGSAVKFTLHPAHDDIDGSLFAKLAAQTAVGSMRGPSPTYARFDWENAITVKLNIDDLSRMLQVFRGECESVNDDKGLFHASAVGKTTIRFRHLLEPVPGYSLEVYRTARETNADTSVRFFFSPSEATGLSLAIENVMGVIAFGIPRVIAHDVSEYRAEARRVRDASAA